MMSGRWSHLQMSGDISLEAEIVNGVNRLGVNADRLEARDAPER